MAQFIQYLYEYQDGKRVRNLGFMKVEMQMDKSIIQIYAKQLDEIKGIMFERGSGEVYLAASEDFNWSQPPQGFQPQEQEGQAPQRPLQNQPQGLQSQQPPEIQTPLQSGMRPRPDMNQQPEMQPRPDMNQQPEMQLSPNMNQQPEMQPRPNMNQQPKMQPRSDMNQQPEMQPRPDMNQQPEMQPRPDMNLQPEMQSQLDTNPQQAQEVANYTTLVKRTFEKIQRQDLSRLPRKEWRIANNSFLLHGFYNYHHLLYIEEGAKTWIGVPGIYHEKEKAAATAFGFSEFIRLVDVDIELKEEEKNTYDDFGYWCRQVERNSL